MGKMANRDLKDVSEAINRFILVFKFHSIVSLVKIYIGGAVDNKTDQGVVDFIAPIC